MAMDNIVSRLAIGIGCRDACPAATIVALVERASQGLDCAEARLFTLTRKAESLAVRDAAEQLNMTIVGLSRSELARVLDAVTIRSARVEAATGVASVAEAAALAGAGVGARLVVPRIAEGGATCAIAVGQGAA